MNAKSYALCVPYKPVIYTVSGTSGVLFEVGLRAAAAASVDNVATWATTFHAFVAAIKFYGGADRGYRTMLDVLFMHVRCIVFACLLSVHACCVCCTCMLGIPMLACVTIGGLYVHDVRQLRVTLCISDALDISYVLSDAGSIVRFLR